MDIKTTDFYDPEKTFDENFDTGPFRNDPTLKPFVNHGKPRYSFLGFPLYSPFGIPAGPLPTSKHVQYAFERGFDVVCYKTQRSVQFPSNEFPNIVYLSIEGDLTLEKAAQPIVGQFKTWKAPDEYTITNSFGNPSRGPNYWTEDLKKAVSYQKKGQLLICSVVGTIQPGFTPEDYYADFAHTAELAAKAGAQVIEINLSCPNVANEGVICYTPEAVEQICQKTKEKIGTIPLVAKLGYYSSKQQALLEKIVDICCPYVAAISAINTIQVSVIDKSGKQLLHGPGRLKSGACGAAIKWAGLDMVKRLAAYRQKKHISMEIIGVGGVMKASDFQEYRAAGADIVQSATGAMWNPNLASAVKAILK